MLPRVRGAHAADDSAPQARAKSIIVLLLEGGMSHLESWDPKPNAPKEIRGEYKPIATTCVDLQVSEHLPKLAQHAHQFNVIRSTYSSARNHSPGLHWALCGHDNPRASVGGEKVNTHPSFGSVICQQRGSVTDKGLPNFVAVPKRTQLGGRVNYTGALHLGAQNDAFESGVLPASAKADYVLPVGLTLTKDVLASRMTGRKNLLGEIDRLRIEREFLSSQVQSVSDYQSQAFEFLLGETGRNAFDINQESPATRARYGGGTMGQGSLLARRLVESGVSHVLVNFSKNNSFDTHRDNFKRLKGSLLPPLDQAVSALISDLDERGLLDDTLVVMMGEMGRTPIINKQAGRDHWPDVYSVMVAGGGTTRGQVIGSSTRGGENPADRPVHLHELLATSYHLMGVDHHLMLPNEENRPIAILPEAQVIHELLA
jgi:hypothetical protein